MGSNVIAKKAEVPVETPFGFILSDALPANLIEHILKPEYIDTDELLKIK